MPTRFREWPTLVGLALLFRYTAVMLHEGGHWLAGTLMGLAPVMGFTGVVQRWDASATPPDGWVRISYPQVGTGWLWMSSVPEGSGQWLAFLSAGPAVSVLLVVAGLAIYITARNLRVKSLALLLCFVVSLGLLGQAFTVATGSRGDQYFIAHYAGIPVAPVRLALSAVYAVGFVVSLRGFRRLPRGRALAWASALAYVVVGVAIMRADAVVRGLAFADSPWVRPLMGWTWPVAVVNTASLAGFLTVWLGNTAPRGGPQAHNRRNAPTQRGR